MGEACPAGGDERARREASARLGPVTDARRQEVATSALSYGSAAGVAQLRGQGVS